MAKIWKACFFGLLVLDIVAAFWVNNVHQAETNRSLLDHNLAWAAAEYREGKAPTIDFSTITPFIWDRLYIFGPYAICEFIDQDLGTHWRDCDKTGVELGEGSLFVFIKDGQVVQYLLTRETSLNDPLENLSKRGFTKQESLFILDEDGWLNWVGNK